MNFPLNGHVVTLSERFSDRLCIPVIDVAIDGEHAGCRGTMADALTLATYRAFPTPVSIIDAMREHDARLTPHPGGGWR